MRKLLLISFLFLSNTLIAFSLLDNLKLATPGDYVVTAQGKNYTLLHIHSKELHRISIEEVTIPDSKIGSNFNWKEWVMRNAPGNTSWILYDVNLPSGNIERCFSLTSKGWLNLSQKGESFLPVLLNLPFTYISEKERRKAGPPPERDAPDHRKLWQPKMVVEGRTIPNVKFDGWRAHWPKDGSELSGRTIDIYLPSKEEGHYPSYFPYWLQIKGAVGKANIRIIDSGRGLVSPIKLRSADLAP